MKNSGYRSERVRAGFTLIEMLVVISIIAILAAFLLPALAGGSKTAKVKKAQMELSQLVQAIQSYYSAYSRYPVSSAAMSIAGANNDDITYGGTFGFPNVSGPGLVTIQEQNGPLLTNEQVIAVLMDSTNFPVNFNHVKNPQQIKFLSPRMTENPRSPGVGPDGVYRDPWGNPYIISMDVNYDDHCLDGVYRVQSVSQVSGVSGWNGLFNPIDPNGNGNHFECNGGVMAWSFGPDGKFDLNTPANLSPNFDNVISWK